MRNLKRALSLAMASVMLLGMMVVGAGAKGYDDVKETDNVEAIEVLQAIEVMVGDERGFGPDRPVNRAEMAVVMGLLLNLDYNYYSATCPFNDVYDWARGWVGACAANGIVSGRGEGVYDPGATVTAVEAASMLMRALGYFKYSSDYADGFEVSTVRQGTTIRIFDGVGSSATEAMTRNQVAQMVLNALKSGMVQPDGNTLNYFDNNGQLIATGGKINYVYVTSRDSFARAISSLEATSMGSTNNAPIVELGEQLYNGDLKLHDYREDAFGRPARNWEYKGESIGDYVKKELLKEEYTTEVTGKDLYDLLGSDTIRNYNFVITIDGVDVKDETGSTSNKAVLEKTGSGKANSYFDESFMARTYRSGVGATGKGVLTQVFVDPDRYEQANGEYRGEVHVAVINTFLAKATKDYSTKDDDITLEVFALQHEGSGDNAVYFKAKEAYKVDDKQSERLDVAGEDFDIADMKKDDIVLVNVANGEIKTISQPEVLSAATLSAFSQNSYIVSEGTQYDYAAAAEYDPEVLDDYTSISATQQLKDTNYNIYLDKYGYMVGIEVVDAVKNYVFLTGIDLGTSNLKNRTANAAGILTDGTFIEFSMDMKDSERANGTEFSAHPLVNSWCTYTVDKDGVYTLTEVKDLAALNADGSKEKAGQYHDADYSGRDIDDKHVSLRSSGTTYVYGNDNTVYLVAELEDVTSDTSFAANTVKMPTNTTNANAVTGGVDKVGIISGVDSVATGIANVNLNTWTSAEIEGEVGAIDNVGHGIKAYAGNVYTLFDDDGYVIAAVVVGEDDGTTKNLVYSNKDKIAKESYDATNDEWTWERVVISNGEEVTLTEKGDRTSVLKNMDENVWYEVNYKADGTVKDAKYAYYTEDTKHVGATPATASERALTKTTSATDADLAGDFVDRIEYVENAINESDKTTVLYEQVWGIGKGDATASNSKQLVENNAPSLKGSTLYVDTLDSRGFYVASDVKSVLIQKNDGKSSTTFGSGTADLEDVLEDLNFDADTNSYCFKISAILTNGRATTVIIHDWTETGAKGNGGGTPSQPAGTKVNLDVKGLTGVKAYDKDDVEIEGTAILGGTRFSVTTGEKITVTFDNPDSKDFAYTTANGKVTETSKTNTSLVFSVSATDVITGELKGEGSSVVLPENAAAAIVGSDGTGSSAAPNGTSIKVVWWEKDDTARATLGKPTLDEAKAVAEAHLKELGYGFAEPTKDSGNPVCWVYTLTKSGYPAGTVKFATDGSDVVEGIRYTDTATGYEIVAKSDNFQKSVANNEYVKMTDADGNVSWSGKGDSAGNEKITITEGMTIETGFTGIATVDNNKVGITSAKNTLKKLAITGTGTGAVITGTGYKAYTDDATTIADNAVITTGYVAVTDAAADTLTINGGSDGWAEAGEEVTIGGVTDGKSVRASVEGGDSIDFTATSTVTSFKIPAEKVTGDITVSDLIAHTLTKAVDGGTTKVTAEWFVNGVAVDFGSDATKVENLGSTDKLTVKITFNEKIDKPAQGANAVGAKLQVNADSATNAASKWTNVGLDEATLAAGVLEFDETKDVAADKTVTAEVTVQTAAKVMKVVYTAPEDHA